MNEIVISEQALTHWRNLTAESDAIVKRIDATVISDDAQEREMSLQLEELKRIQKHADMVRRQEVEPLNQQVKAINDRSAR